MKKKARIPGFSETINLLRNHGFEISMAGGAEGAALVSKHGAGAVLTQGAAGPEFAVRPGALIRGEVARLLDRGYQKFIAAGQIELPATAEQLQAIQNFSAELKELVGGTSLYNESLGTTSDKYLYDRLKGRDQTEQKGTRPWELTSGH
jgi:hypothetical protein